MNDAKGKMKVVGKRILCVVLSFAIFCFSLFDFEYDSYAAEKDADNTFEQEVSPQTDEEKSEPDIDRQEAKEVAGFQVSETIKKGETDWESGTKVSRVYPLYNADKEIRAYAVELKRGSEDAGYVVVGADKENPPIIEFRTSGKFLDENLQSDEYLLYDGSINYYKVDEKSNQATSINGSQESVPAHEIETADDEPERAVAEENRNEWNVLLNQARSSGGSNPPTQEKQGVNSTPSLYENGYKSITRKTAPDASLYTYFITSDFSQGSVCVPTAAVNLIKYYHDRKRLPYSLVYNNSWMETFNKLKTYCKTIEFGEYAGTSMFEATSGLDKYLHSMNIPSATTHYYGFDDDDDGDVADWAEMKRRIDFGEPFIYGVSEHYIYDDHAVLAVGYLQYNYDRIQSSGLKTSRYLQVADGWTNHADRYINVDVGTNSEYDEMITLYFIYSNSHK